MYDQPPPMKQRRPPSPGIPGGSPGPTPPGTGGVRLPPSIPGGSPGPMPPTIPGGQPGPTGIGGYPANDLPPAAMGVQTHMNPMPPRLGGSGGPSYGGPPIPAGMPPRTTRPPVGMPGGGPGPTPPGPPQFGGTGGPGLSPGLPPGAYTGGIFGGGPQPPMPPPPMAFPPGGSSPMTTYGGVKGDTGMPDEWRRQRQRQALGQEQ